MELLVGMGTVVAKDVTPLSIVGSAPQRSIKTRDARHYHRLDTAQQYSGMSGYPLLGSDSDGKGK
jgi:serine acetyltransferase